MRSAENGFDSILVENVNEMMFHGQNGWWKDLGFNKNSKHEIHKSTDTVAR